MTKNLQYAFYKTGISEQKVIVAIHGWAGDRYSMYPLMKMMKIYNADWYLLEAPYKVKQGNGRSWSYQISDGVWEVDEPKRLLNSFFSEIFEKYPSVNIYVLGFSQGAMVCLDFALFLDKPLGGVFPISGFLRHTDKESVRLHHCQADTPILIGHGKDDDKVPVEASVNAYRLLKGQGANVELLLYKGKHKIGMEYIKKMSEMIQR
jgi:phospholipase/carboxylesterase